MKTFEWRLQKLLTSNMRIQTASELTRRLQALGHEISYRQVVRLAHERPTNLNIDLLAGIVSILECSLDELLVLQEPLSDDARHMAAAQKAWDSLSKQERNALKKIVLTDE